MLHPSMFVVQFTKALQFGIFVIYKSFRVPVYSAQMFPSMFAVQFTKALQFDVFVIHKSVSSICCSHDCLLDCYNCFFFCTQVLSPVYLLLTKVFQCSALFYCSQDRYCPSVNVLLKMASQSHLLCCSLDLYSSSFFTGAGR